MNNFKRINNVAGWAVCAIASLVYLLTIEPTTSFWDCGEFIASSYKLEVGHPPGNPVFQLFGRLFSMFVSPEYVAPMINSLSALCSGFTILFLFWTITHLARRIMEHKGGELTTGNTIAIIGAGVVGALAYAFSDTFWFSAVEAEVYAMSSLFTAAVFWAILKWEEEAGQPYANRWIILIAFLMGLSLGVHLLNLLAIPAIVFVYYFKKTAKIKAKGVLLMLLLSGMLVLAMLWFIPLIPTIAAYFDLFFVNSLGLPFNSGTAFSVLLLLALAAYGIVVTHRKRKVVWNTIILSFTVALIGYSSFAVVIIRSSANTPTNENQPDNPFSLRYYLNREQYGSAPLFSGPTYATPPISAVEKTTYVKDKGKYVKAASMPEYKYDTRYNMLFPRMYSREESHRNVYKQYVNSKRRGIVTSPYTEEPIPSFRENLAFFFDYQINWMYIRYFMWNFAGRQNDIQGHGNSYNGNWECGIPFIDNTRLGDMSDMPPYLAENKARNHYYLLPLLLGLAGLFYQMQKDKRNFVVVLFLFILTGAAIVVYLNQTPMQPRERDYAYAGSFYAFAIWIGLGVYAVYDFIQRKLKTPAAVSAGISGALCLLVPLQMAAENWDDHDRSNRYSARDVAYNYLNSCDENAILFTNGDNDTFPLWYIQEVEGVRTDVRVVNLSLLGTDWYIDQMKYRMYESEPVPFKLSRENYIQGTNDFVTVREQLRGAVPVSTIMEFISNPRYRARTQGGEMVSYIPARNIAVPVNKENIYKNRRIEEKVLPDWVTNPIDTNQLLDTMMVKITKNDISKPDMMILDLLANNDWERPVYFVSMGVDPAFDLRNYFQYLGFTYKLMPLREAPGKQGILINTDELYDKMMNVYRWGNMNKKGVFVDYNNSLTLAVVLNVRNMHARLAENLMSKRRNEEAVAVLDSAMARMPACNFPLNISNDYNDVVIMNIIKLYYQLGETGKADTLAQEFVDLTEKNLVFFSKLRDASHDLELNLYYMQQMGTLLASYNEELSAWAAQQTEFYLTKMGYTE
ncbi:MAG: DUF2723 domain-containing protein [Prevotellaceae bacterium]|jgi:hypothetical protein|nr:DUF2723 domain-containing protein [Prevotellaceae bacterium]